MRTLAITQNMSIDGSIELLGDWFDPSDQAEDLAEELMRQSAREDVLLLGRQTFEDLRGFWPQQTSDTTGVAAHLNRVRKVVVSPSLAAGADPAGLDLGWENSTVLGEDWLDRVRDLKAEDGQDVVVTGSITLCHALIDTGLVDEFRFFVYPAVQGRGRRLFPDGAAERRLTLTDARSFANGVALLTYAAR